MIDALLVAASKALVGAYPRWIGCRPEPRQRIYFANHASHLDTVALWSALPPALWTRPRWPFKPLADCCARAEAVRYALNKDWGIVTALPP